MVVTLEKRQKITVIGGQRPPALKGTLAVVSGVVTHTRPPDFGENPKKVECLKGGANTSRMMYRGPQGTSGRAEGRGGALPPNYSGFLPFL